MRQIARLIILIVSLAALLSTYIQGNTVQTSQRRRQKGRSPKVIAPAKNAPSPARGSTSPHDLGVEVKKTPFGRVLILTNREKVSITVRKVTINGEWELKKDNDNLLHSTKSWVSLPVELLLGDSLRVPISSYRREVIYIDLDTDKGALTFKVNR